jgi:hypothetical protein
MGIKYIHVTLIVVSIALCIGFGLWTLNHDELPLGYASFALAAGLFVYCVQFVKKMKAL